MDTGKTPRTLVSDFFEQVRQDAIPRIVRATVPFYAVQDDKIKRDRSGVLVRVGDEYFILTASHELKAIVEANICLYVGQDTTECIPVPIPDSRFHTTEENSRDIAVIKLSSSTASKLLTSSEPIALREIAFAENRRPGFFVVCGYPMAWMTILPDRVDSLPLAFLGRFFQRDPPPTDTFEYDDKLHILIEFTRNAIRSGDFQKCLLPSTDGIKGISGCGVWRVADYSPESLKSWNPKSLQLIGIQHRYWQQQGCIAATWMKFVMERMVAEYPELVPAMRLVYP